MPAFAGMTVRGLTNVTPAEEGVHIFSFQVRQGTMQQPCHWGQGRRFCSIKAIMMPFKKTQFGVRAWREAPGRLLAQYCCGSKLPHSKREYQSEMIGWAIFRTSVDPNVIALALGEAALGLIARRIDGTWWLGV